MRPLTPILGLAEHGAKLVMTAASISPGGTRPTGQDPAPSFSTVRLSSGRACRISVWASARRSFAYAERWDEAKQTYEGLAISTAGNVQVVIDSESVIVRPDVAEVHRPKPKDLPGPVPPGPPDPPEDDESANAPPTEQNPTRFLGTVMISPDRPAREMHKVVEAIIEQLTTLPGSEVSLKLEIDAEVPSGLDRAKVRTLLENSTTLGFIDKLVK